MTYLRRRLFMRRVMLLIAALLLSAIGFLAVRGASRFSHIRRISKARRHIPMKDLWQLLGPPDKVDIAYPEVSSFNYNAALVDNRPFVDVCYRSPFNVIWLTGQVDYDGMSESSGSILNEPQYAHEWYVFTDGEVVTTGDLQGWKREGAYAIRGDTRLWCTQYLEGWGVTVGEK